MINENVRVSIIVPVYNAEKYIDKCICSILEQTYKNIEIVIIDDGSLDRSYEILKNYSERDERIVLIREKNKGAYKTRIEGIEKSTGEYIMFVDSDDWIDSTMVEDMLSLTLKYKADICKCGIVFETEDDKKKNIMYNITDREIHITKPMFEKEVYNRFISTYNLCSVYTQLIKLEKVKITNTGRALSFAEDLQFNLELYSNIDSVVVTEKNYYHYVKNEESVTKTYTINRINQNIENTIFVYGSLFEYLKRWDIDSEENRKLVANRVLKEIAVEIIKLSKIKGENLKVIYSKIKEICKNNIMDIIKQNLEKEDINNENIFIKTIENNIYNCRSKKIIFLLYLVYKPYIKLKSKGMKR